MAKQQPKRSIKDVSNSRNGNKRPRRSSNLESANMDDDTTTTASPVVPTNVVAEGAIMTRAAAVMRVTARKQASPPQQQHLASFPSRFVPHNPPTPCEVRQQLVNQRTKQTPPSTTNNTSKRKNSTPKAPPPSPFTPKKTTATENIKNHARHVLTDPRHDSLVSSMKSSTATQQRCIPLFLILFLIPAVLISTAIFLPQSKQPAVSFTFQEERGKAFAKHRPTMLFPSPAPRLYKHIIPPNHVFVVGEDSLSDLTLRDFLQDSAGIHLAMAPAFFGFYAYFGALAAWNEELIVANHQNHDNNNETSALSFLNARILSVAGGSAGAMAAVLIAAGICPRKAAQYCASLTLGKFADPPGWGGLFRGNLFEELMKDFMKREGSSSDTKHAFLLEHANIPVAVSAFDIKTLQGKIIHKGCMARAARASATFPLLFQPVHWPNDNDSTTASYLIDGGVTDGLGLMGLSALLPNENNKRIVNVVVGGDFPRGDTKGPSDMPEGIQPLEVLSISIRNTPLCGPWAMSNGPRAVEAARLAMKASLDIPLYKGKEQGHYELHIDASDFVPSKDQL